MNRAILVLWLLAALVACDSSDGPRDATTFAEDSLSLVAPDGWRVKHEKDTLVFVGGAPAEKDQAVIAIRAVPVDGWSEPRTAETVVPSVRTVLAALPGAQVKGPTSIEHPAYRALAFDVVFTPRSKRGQRYQRRHVVLEANQHIYHVFLTAPQRQMSTNLPEFERVLASLREEA